MIDEPRRTVTGREIRGVSDYLITLVEIVFAVVVAESLNNYQEIVLRPFAYEHFLAALGLLVVYICTVWSWIDWHVTMDMRPYDVRPDSPTRRLEELRVWSDLAIVIVYAYLLFSISYFDDSPDSSMVRYIIAYPFVFLLYFISGWLRRKTYAARASNYPPIFIALGLTSALAGGYVAIAAWRDYQELLVLNVVTLVALLLIIVGYRVGRRMYVDRLVEAPPA